MPSSRYIEKLTFQLKCNYFLLQLTLTKLREANNARIGYFRSLKRAAFSCNTKSPRLRAGTSPLESLIARSRQTVSVVVKSDWR